MMNKFEGTSGCLRQSGGFLWQLGVGASYTLISFGYNEGEIIIKNK